MDLLFPGVPVDESMKLPRTLKELLQWKELTLDIPLIVSNAAEILENTRRRGASDGDVMDKQTGSIFFIELGLALYIFSI